MSTAGTQDPRPAGLPGRAAAALAAPRFDGALRPERLLLDGGAAAWVAHGFASFRGFPGTEAASFAVAYAATAALLLAALGTHRRPGAVVAAAARLTAALVVLTGAGAVVAAAGIGRIDGPAAAWLAAATLTFVGLGRAVVDRVAPPGPAACAEAGRWIVLGLAVVALFHPFHTNRPVGAGDAYWYTLMLADFVEQVRAGQFPVWVGATEYAFNGAVSPLRLAPWFQHAGALLDLLTARSLPPLALKNALLCLSAAALAASVYGGLRSLLARTPGIALLLALAALASPACLAPLYVGDQYMTFLALPFLVWVAFGLARVGAGGGGLGAHVLLGAGGGGLWLAHPPIALWTTGLAGVAYAVIALARRRIDWPLVGLAVAIAALAGGYTVVSVVSLDNTNNQQALASAAIAEIARAFPSMLRALSPDLNQPADYQPGLLLLAVGAGLLVGLAFRRPPAALGLALAAVCAYGLVLPLPGVAAWWELMPGAVMRATNVWPMQRLVPIGTLLAVFAVAAWLAEVDPLRRRFVRLALGLLLAGGLAWSGREASRLVAQSRESIPSAALAGQMIARHNLLLTRYSFVSFLSTPAYFSHGYMDPVLEHRLLRRDGSVLAANAESAVRRGARPAPAGPGPVARGVWTAVNDNHSVHYILGPALELPGDTRLALLVEERPGRFEGWLQVRSPGLFREYMLPDSGAGIERRQPSRAFGLLPTSSRVMPLFRRAGDPQPSAELILPARPDGPPFEFADFELWRYDPQDLPVRVRSFVPYHLEVDVPEPAFVELPRVWLGGYRTKIHGRHVAAERSPDDLVLIPVPAGRTEFIVKWIPSLTLELAYWTCLATWGGLAVFAAARLRLRAGPDRA